MNKCTKFTAIILVNVEIFHSEAKLWTDIKISEILRAAASL